MEPDKQKNNRRNFIKVAGIFSAGIPSMSFLPKSDSDFYTTDDNINIIGPKAGYSPQIGTMVSELTWMRAVVLHSVQGMTRSDLDFLFDSNSNTIGAMLMHLAATESYYQINTFQGLEDFPDNDKKIWGIASDLGEPARKSIKGHELKYYTDMLDEVRGKTLSEFRKRDDKWLMKIDKNGFDDKPTNNYCKWFHVCEHESNHNGQIKWIAKRIPGRKAPAE